MNREIILDTETTGLSVSNGDRIIEIGCVEVIDKKLTGLTYHTYINPERELSDKATEVSGLTYEFLKNHRFFRDIFQEFLDFILDDKLVIHNASFDMGFLNRELELVGSAPLHYERAIDTLKLARKKYPGSPATLDALCRRFNVDCSTRTKHGALIDANLLAEVYLEMSVETVQKSIFSVLEPRTIKQSDTISKRPIIPERVYNPTSDEIATHRAFLSMITNPLWKKFYNS
ncbi:MAG: DNA polymerase III subunit epsilon [Holosporales bacterium]|jgi:DNA polymerase-3 subunit epsilon|nr:DNA polymerase III subunit epsilon [Holosporales bacterium]